MSINDDAVDFTDDIADFYRPFGETVPRVDGPLSKQAYVTAFTRCWQEYVQRTGLRAHDFAALCTHLPYTKMGWKALRTIVDPLASSPDPSDVDTANRLTEAYQHSIMISRRVGNLYTGSLYLGLISLLSSGTVPPQGRIGMFSYGSGCMGEVFSMQTEQGYHDRISATIDLTSLDRRRRLGMEAYEAVMRSGPTQLP